MLVTGMHRSGTTAFTKLLERNKINMGPFQDPNSESRLYGWDLNYYLQFLGGNWDTPENIVRTNSGHYKHARALFINRIENRLVLHRKISPLSSGIGFKHPISSLLLEELTQIKNLKIIRVKRSASEIVNSLMARKPRTSLSIFPGQMGFSQFSNNKERMVRLVNLYESELDKHNAKIEFTVKYAELCDENERLNLESALSACFDKEIKIPIGFFKRRQS